MRRARTVPPLLLALALACLTHSAAGAGVFELQILEFSNYRLRLASGACCGGAGGAEGTAGAGAGGAGVEAPCASPCRARFALCLKEYQSAVTPSACSFGRAASPVLGTDSFTLAEPLYTLSLPFSFRWTRSFTLILQAYDDYNYTDPEETGLIEEAWWSGIVEPGAEWHALRHAGRRAALAYRVRVQCAPNYYNTTCTAFCRPRDDKFGHYACSPHGAKHCLPGWQGDNCEKPVCKEGCHPTHGRCDRPGDCDCRPGWRGELCAQCQPYPGCKHGYCNGSSWDCTCDTNWGGILCDQDLNYCGTHEPCLHGGTCENTAPDQYLCSCADGFSGVDCERVDNPCAPQPCSHGVCTLSPEPPGFACACEPGWSGALCDADLDDCAPAPCAHASRCRDLVNGFACDCTPGWTGPTCTEDVDECAADVVSERSEGGASGASTAGGRVRGRGLGPCVNAFACNNTLGGYSCACLAGWTGRDCETNVDDCAAGQCLNGATCIDLVDDFHCACAAGFAGRVCAIDVDECAPRPCRNGGECVDLRDAYRCICPVGFAGTNCELPPCSGRYCPDDRDHCAGAPCGNGAACYTAQDDYYCHCAPGWAGRNCTQRAASPASTASTADPCVGSAPCAHGRCLRAPAPAPSAAPRCLCAPGYAGPLCADRVEECTVGGCGAGGSCLESTGRCACAPGWTGVRCDTRIDECANNPCHNNATCVAGPADFACLCLEGWTGKTCGVRVEGRACADGTCANGGSCVREGGEGRERCVCAAGWGGIACDLWLGGGGGCGCLHGACGGAGACVCREGWGGARCDVPLPLPLPAGCSSAPCRNGGHCVGGTGWWACECRAGWAGADCSLPAPAPAPACSPSCPAPAVCHRDAIGARCVCPDTTARANTRCLELIAGLDLGDEVEDGESGQSGGFSDVTGLSEGGALPTQEAWAAGAGGAARCAGNGSWWWGCNACRCGGGAGGGAPLCTRLWCGLPDCLAPQAAPCHSDEVCVPAAPALCVRAPCAPLGECRRVVGRRVEPPALPVPPTCWPGAGTGPRAAAAAAPPAGCARATLQLARERVGRGAHVERACASLRRALAAVLAAAPSPSPSSAAAPAPPLVLLCDLAVDDDDALDLALWIGEEEGFDSSGSAETLGVAVRALSELVARRRLGSHALLGAALRLRVAHAPSPATPSPTASPPAARAPHAALLALAALGPLLLLGLGAALVLRRRRAAAERMRRCDEEKSNNLQNEENLRRYANPLREDTAVGVGVGVGVGEELPRAHTLYKAQNADVRNNTPPRDKEFTKRALPPPEPPPPARRPPPERLTVLV